MLNGFCKLICIKQWTHVHMSNKYSFCSFFYWYMAFPNRHDLPHSFPKGFSLVHTWLISNPGDFPVLLPPSKPFQLHFLHLHIKTSEVYRFQLLFHRPLSSILLSLHSQINSLGFLADFSPAEQLSSLHQLLQGWVKWKGWGGRQRNVRLTIRFFNEK